MIKFFVCEIKIYSVEQFIHVNNKKIFGNVGVYLHVHCPIFVDFNKDFFNKSFSQDDFLLYYQPKNSILSNFFIKIKYRFVNAIL